MKKLGRKQQRKKERDNMKRKEEDAGPEEATHS